MLRRRGRPGLAILAAALFALALSGGCRRGEPERKITYTPDPRALQSQNQQPFNPSAQPGAGTPGAAAARPNDPMNDPELARKGQDILRRTGGDVNKMTEQEKATFIEAARNGHL